MIVFSPAEHKYTNNLTGEEYTSVTRVIGTFKQKFDDQAISAAVAARKGVSQQSVLDEWKQIKDVACEHGTAVHAAIEAYIKDEEYDPIHAAVVTEFARQGKFKASSGVLSEQLLYDHTFKIAGTADIIVPVGKYFDIIDIKTNDTIHTFSKYDKYMLTPVDHLSDCEISSYALQLSIYAILYQRQTGRIPRQLRIFHFDKESNQCTQYPLPFLKLEALALLNAYANTRRNHTSK